MIHAIRFFKEYICSPKYTGALAPSSGALADCITDYAGLDSAEVIVELGSGTGVFTERILHKKSKEAKLFAFEINEGFARITKRRCLQAEVIVDSASRFPLHLQERGYNFCDSVICGLPWALFSGVEQEANLEAISRTLSKTGVFTTFTYLHSPLLPAGRAFARRLEKHFNNVSRSEIVWNNLPPAFVYIAQNS